MLFCAAFSANPPCASSGASARTMGILHGILVFANGAITLAPELERTILTGRLVEKSQPAWLPPVAADERGHDGTSEEDGRSKFVALMHEKAASGSLHLAAPIRDPSIHILKLIF